jgi:hypothetical protein
MFITWIYGGVSKSFWIELIRKYILSFGITRSEATQRVMAAKLTRLTHKIAIQLHLVAESCTICSSHSWQPFQKFLDTTSCARLIKIELNMFYVDCGCWGNPPLKNSHWRIQRNHTKLQFSIMNLWTTWTSRSTPHCPLTNYIHQRKCSSLHSYLN